MNLEFLDILFIILVLASAIWVFIDAKKRTPHPVLWSLVALFGFYPLGFIFYLARVRNKVRIVNPLVDSKKNKENTSKKK